MSQDKEQITVHETQTGMTLHSLGTRIKTPEELIEATGYDLNEWKVAWVQARTYEKGYRVDERVEGERVTTGALVIPMTTVRVKLEPRSLEEKLDVVNFLTDVARFAPTPGKVHCPIPGSESSNALEISIPDLHLGVRGSDNDTPWGVDDIRSAGLSVIDSAMSQGEALGGFDEIVFPVGNDLLNMDRYPGMTTRGTATGNNNLDWYDQLVHSTRLMIEFINRMRGCPVIVPIVPGNHDAQSALAAGLVLDAYYKNDPMVTINATKKPRKYYRFGKVLLGFEHGKDVKVTRLAAVMATECPKAWAETQHRAWHLGDQHRPGQTSKVAFSEQGIDVEYLPSLSPTSSYEDKHGWTAHDRSAVSFLWNRDAGQVARFRHGLEVSE